MILAGFKRALWKAGNRSLPAIRGLSARGANRGALALLRGRRGQRGAGGQGRWPTWSGANPLSRAALNVGRRGCRPAGRCGVVRRPPLPVGRAGQRALPEHQQERAAALELRSSREARHPSMPPPWKAATPSKLSSRSTRTGAPATTRG
ncbi:hypothetical protein ACU4GD_06270 [Cupriavidus basilensis]